MIITFSIQIPDEKEQQRIRFYILGQKSEG